MANTEEMSDEAAKKRLSVANGAESQRRAATPSTSSGTRALERRMERIPMSDGRPAARVIRYSKPLRRGKPSPVPSPITETACPSPPKVVSSNSTSTTSSGDALLSSPAVRGDVMERQSLSRRRKQQHQPTRSDFASRTTAPPSRFARTALQSGFPSVHHVPLGQLVKNLNKTRTSPDNGDCRMNQHDASSSLEQTRNEKTNTSLGMDNENSKDDTGNNDDETATIQRQAQAMLEQMSPAEIKHHVQDLEAEFSPETIAFLKQRSQKQKRSSSKKLGSATQETPRKEKEMMITPLKQITDAKIMNTADSSSNSNDNSSNGDTAEKQRLAHVLSSIRTYEDLDMAYAQEVVKEQFEFTADPTRSTANAQDNNVDVTFDTACDMLRSSVPRQNLWAARTVSQQLQQDMRRFGSVYALGGIRRIDRDYKAWPYPTLLPVSLRCLLDTSASKQGLHGAILHTHVLQALYALLRLRCSTDHVHGIVTADGENNAAMLYQEYFLDDAIPTPPLHTCYSPMSVQPVDQNNNIVYATMSSSTSAQQDGEAFVRDPLWTLLSRMRIIPRLAEILLTERGGGEEQQPVTIESLVAICGILTLVAQRSPGAATAIVQHPTLLRDLAERSFLPHSIENANDGDSNSQQEEKACYLSRADPALATLFLGCVLARQSRVAAQGLDAAFLPLDFPRFLMPSTTATSSTAVKQQRRSLQKWTLVLWRTRLRYGLSLADLPTVLTIAAPHCVFGMNHPQEHQVEHGSLARYYFSAFTVVLHCIRAVKAGGDMKGEDVDASSSNNRDLLAQAGGWLSSSKRLALQHITGASCMTLAEPCTERCLSQLQYLTSILRYLDGWLLASLCGAADDTGEFKSEELTEMEEEDCLKAILSFLRDDSFKAVFGVALQYCFHVDFSVLPKVDGAALAFEAGSCAFVDALLTLAASISNSFASGENQTLIGFIREEMLDRVELLPKDGAIKDVGSHRSAELSRRFWLNRTHTSLVRFLASTAIGPIEVVTQIVALSVIGRLERGEESSATLLFSCDNLFRPQNSGEPAGFISTISTFFVRELCLTEHARLQLDHSFKLGNALGLTSNRMGPFETQSLRSEADGIPVSSSKDFLLPMGSLWLWKVFGGIVVDRELNNEVGQVLLTALELVYELEAGDGLARRNYVGKMDVGGRLYFLMNICFQSFLFRQERLSIIVNDLTDRYTRAMDTTAALGFARESMLHSTASSSRRNGQTEDHVAEEKQVALLLDPSVASMDMAWDQKQLHSVESFMGDLCDAYLEIGAQYPFFTVCLRSFLCSGFPSKVRCKMIERLRDVPHLLSLPEEKCLPSSLLVCLTGGRPSVDKSKKDTPDILDACALLLSRYVGVLSDASFVVSWATAMLARSLAAHLDEGREGGLSVSKRRIMSLHPSFAHRVVLATEDFLASPGTKRDLVAASVRCCRDVEDRAEFLSVGDNHTWDLVLVRLRKVCSKVDESLH